MSGDFALGLNGTGFFLVSLIAMVLITCLGYIVGWRIGPPKNAAQSSAINTALAAIFVIVGLILSFTFSFVVGLTLQRWTIIVQEADAIGTTYLRTDALQPVDRQAMRAAMRRYTDTLIDFYGARDDARIAADYGRVGQIEQQIWTISAAELNRRNTFSLSLLQQTINDMFDRGADQRAALNLRLRYPATTLIFLASIIGAFMIGLAFGQSHTANWLISVSFCILLVAFVFVIVDLNDPRSGVIRVNVSPLVDVRRSMQGP